MRVGRVHRIGRPLIGALLLTGGRSPDALGDHIVVDPTLADHPSADRVVGTLGEAVAWAREQRDVGEGIRISLVSGVHVVRRGVRIGTELSGLTLEGLGPGARIVGAIVIADPSWEPVDDPGMRERFPDHARAEVRMLRLGEKARADWAGGLSGPVHRGMGVPASRVRSELFIDRQAQSLARWPNEGFARVRKVTDPGSIPRKAADDIPESERVVEPDRGGTFVLEHRDRLARWTHAGTIWAHGYWWWDWADEQIPVASIDPSSASVTLALPHRYGLRDSAVFSVSNLPEELDTPGEYWIDVERGIVYAWVPEDSIHREAAVSMLGEPILTLSGAHDITIEGLSFEMTRAGAIVASDCEGLTIRNCTFSNLGTRAVDITGRGCVIARCLFEDIGGGGVSLRGGDRRSLTHAGNVVEDCVFRRCARIMRTYNPAIGLGGVGQRAIHNEISDLPHVAIMFSGNEHLIEGNRIRHVVQETGDAGAIYCGRDWTLHGTVIRGNFFSHIRGSDARYQNAAYLDDMASGITVEHNLFVRCNWGMLIGGGRDNAIRSNAFVSCGRALHYDARGVGWMSKFIADPKTSTLHRNLAAVPIDSEPWASRYPTLRTYLTDRFGRPVGGVVRDNVLIDTPLGFIEDRRSVRVENNRTLVPSRDGVMSSDEILASARDPLAVLKAAGFEPIRFGATGPRTARVGAPRAP